MFSRHAREKLVQQKYAIVLPTIWHLVLIGLTLHPEGDVLLAKHLPYSFRLPLVAVTAVSMIVMTLLVEKIRSPRKAHSIGGAVHPAVPN